jgi:site-specific DNA recombinase
MTRREKHRYYRCNGAWRTPKVCDTPHFRVNDVDEVIWEWVSEMLLNPESLAEGLQGMQEETIRSNQALFDRLDIIEKRIAETDKQLEKLLDLYLSDGFPKELLQERKGRLDETLANLLREQIDISAHLQTKVLSDEQIADIEAFCEQIRHGLEIATFEQKRQVIDLLDVRGTLAIENDERVIYVSCLIAPQPVSLALILPLSSIGVTATTSCVSHPTARSP